MNLNQAWSLKPIYIPNLRPSDTFIADDLDVASDCWHLAGCRTGCFSSPKALLSVAEVERLKNYSKAYQQSHFSTDYRDLVVHLGDNPKEDGSGWTVWSAAGGKIPAIRKTGSLYYIPSLHRHMTLREMFLAMGYPTFPLCLETSHLTQMYRVFRPGVSWNDMRKALGNSMVVPQVGTVMGCMLICLRQRLLHTSFQDMARVCPY